MLLPRMSLEVLEVSVKVEPGGAEECERVEEISQLYAGHVKKEDLVLGPELLQPADAVFELQASLKREENDLDALTLLGTTCTVALERIHVDLKHRVCRVGQETYKLRSFQSHCMKNEKESCPRKKLKNCGLKEREKLQTNTSIVHVKKEGEILTKAKIIQNISASNCEERNPQLELLTSVYGSYLKENDGVSFKCSIDTCNNTFQTKSLLKHANKEHEIKYLACKDCQYVTDSVGIQISDLTTRKEKPFKCDQCTASFVRSCHLKRHQRRHTGNKPFKCRHCSATFMENWTLLRHQALHTGRRPFKCSDCSLRFTQRYNLKRHERIHTGEKPYKCDICGASFTQGGDLKTHLRIHSGEKPFKCDICGFKAAQSCGIKTHKARNHFGLTF